MKFNLVGSRLANYGPGTICGLLGFLIRPAKLETTLMEIICFCHSDGGDNEKLKNKVTQENWTGALIVQEKQLYIICLISSEPLANWLSRCNRMKQFETKEWEYVVCAMLLSTTN